eukprot:NODE_1856_length_1357_cov_51.022764_g1764_i0.p1 GENE.NODE_1856_length_1357_cov_51.022764_g1764_i0~~NODE_1856_length_1357_cov_51.022764_g1764_i0.p1  ORF type:complete len:419 (+),score=96.48 NODE_1856_length_1357_cov_51.022764_g1764_i0:51-1307(+)
MECRHLFLLVLACLHIVLVGGVVYGWAALLPLLKAQGVLAGPRQQSQLSMVGIVGVSASALCKLPVGVFLDHFGPRWTSIMGASCFIVGNLFLGYGAHASVWQHALGYFLIGTAGPSLQMPCFQFANLFGPHATSATSLFVVMFELSTVGYLVYSWLHQWLGLTLAQLCTCSASSGVFILLSAFYFWPDFSCPIVDTTESDEDTLRGHSMGRQLLSWLTLYLSLLVTENLFRQGLVFESITLQCQALFPSHVADHLAAVFSVMLPLGFLPMLLLVVTGLARRILQRPPHAFVLILCLTITYGCLLLVPHPAAFYTVFLLFPITRQLMFACFFSVSMAQFGPATFGRMQGLISTIAGTVQLTAIFLARLIFHHQLSWSQVNTGLLGAEVALLIVAVFMCLRAPPPSSPYVILEPKLVAN